MIWWRARRTPASWARTLPPRGQLEHEVGAGIAGALRGGIGRPVAGDDDLEPVRRVVQRPQVGDPLGDDRLLGIGGDDDRDTGERGVGAWRGRARRPAGTYRCARAPDAVEHGQRRRIAGVRVHEKPCGGPERGLEQRHGG